MLGWADAFRRTVVGSPDFRMLFGRMYAIDEFRYYAYALKFESLAPALLSASSSTPNTGNLATTVASNNAPATNLVPGTAAEVLLPFPAGAIVLGVTAAAILPQKISTNEGGNIAFKYGPSNNPGGRDLFMLDLEYADGSDIVAGNPISELVSSPNFPTNTAPPILADALLGSGCKDVMPGRELLVTPGLGIVARVRSMVLPNAPAATGINAPNLAVHLVFHCMVPGVVKRATPN